MPVNSRAPEVRGAAGWEWGYLTFTASQALFTVV